MIPILGKLENVEHVYKILNVQYHSVKKTVLYSLVPKIIKMLEPIRLTTVSIELLIQYTHFYFDI